MRNLLLYFCASVFLCFGTYAAASVVIDGTRVIYPEGKPEVTVRMTNEGEDPKLVQVWIDDGNKQESPDKISVPFVVLTPIFRMDPSKGQAARIQYTGSKPLPTDRESVFWLNVLEIPAKPSAEMEKENYLQFRFRTRIKLFFRPKGIEGLASNAPDKIKIKYKPGYVELENPTAFHVSISSLEVGDGSVGGKLESEMIQPFSKKLIALSNAAKTLDLPKIKFRAINDFGGAQEIEKQAVNF